MFNEALPPPKTVARNLAKQPIFKEPVLVLKKPTEAIRQPAKADYKEPAVNHEKPHDSNFADEIKEEKGPAEVLVYPEDPINSVKETNEADLPGNAFFEELPLPEILDPADADLRQNEFTEENIFSEIEISAMSDFDDQESNAELIIYQNEYTQPYDQEYNWSLSNDNEFMWVLPADPEEGEPPAVVKNDEVINNLLENLEPNDLEEVQEIIKSISKIIQAEQNTEAITKTQTAEIETENMAEELCLELFKRLRLNPSEDIIKNFILEIKESKLIYEYNQPLISHLEKGTHEYKQDNFSLRLMHLMKQKAKSNYLLGRLVVWSWVNYFKLGEL